MSRSDLSEILQTPVLYDAIGQSLQSLQELFETQQHRLPTDQRLRVSEPFTTEMKNRSGCQIELIRSILAAKKALTDMATLDGCLKQTHADPSCFQELQDRLVVLQRNVVVQESQAVAQASQTKGLADVSLEEIHEQLRDIRIRSQQGLERISQGKVRTQDSLVSEKRAIVHFIPTTTEGMFEMMQDVDASMAKASQKK